jgi:hypothetical protein
LALNPTNKSLPEPPQSLSFPVCPNSLTGFTASDDAKQTLDAGESDNDTIYGGAGDDAIYLIRCPNNIPS